jgi:multidrug efflux pump subunit AcrB
MDVANRVYTDYEELLPGINISVDPIESNRLGINETFLGLGLASKFGGSPLTTIWEGDYALPVVLKTKRETKDPSAEDVANEYISGRLGANVSLRQIAEVKPDWNEGQIARRNGVRTLTVAMDIKRGKNVTLVQAEIEKLIDALPRESVSKFSINYGGTKGEEKDTMPKMMMGLALAIVIIFFILVFHFKKVSLAALLLSFTAISLLGSAIGLKIMGMNFGITGILGIVSLIGIIVRNGIIMYDYAEELRYKHGKSVLEASLEAGRRRMRPVFLTSAAASMGVIPMIISMHPLWAPMGTVICFGTVTSMFFILTMLPLLYWIIYKNEDKKAAQITE